MPSPVSFFGIRHHGPGSARSLLQALDALRPDLLLIEGPPEGEALLPLVGDPEMQPPVALLVYNPKNLRQASFFPFAEFSPEWQALRFALAGGITARFMDLPVGNTFALEAEPEGAEQIRLNFPEPQAPLFPQAPAPARADPFAEIARLAGYSDPERWWEAMFERQATAPFPLILELFETLRDDKARRGAVETPETLLREAHMRQTLRAAQKEGFQNIAVICGAWHTPALAGWQAVKASADAALLKGLKKVKTQSTWIPWSFDRLALQSGYGAGVTAPAWYRQLWEAGQRGGGESPQAIWLARAARLLREHDLTLSSAHVLEALRLADTLAALRDTPLPGIEELREAAVTVLCGGEKPFELIERQLVVGDVLGAVPAATPTVPLRTDFDRQIKSARLSLSSEEQLLKLDLREAAHLQKSRLLHRLELLGIPWGKTAEIGGNKEGRFHEHWTLQWLPDYEIRLIEAGTWGNTVEAAAAQRVVQRAARAGALPELVQLLGAVLRADLVAVMPPLLSRLRQAGALTRDALLLADAVLPLVEVLRYGHARALDLSAVEQLLEQILPRLFIQLPGAARGLAEDAAEEFVKKMLAVNRALNLWQRPEFLQPWQTALTGIDHSGVAQTAGLAARLLFDAGARSREQTAGVVQFHLSHAQPPRGAALWLDGFLQGSGLLLIHQPALWQILDHWVGQVQEPDFPELLPLLRRTFSRFSGPEREKMLNLARLAVLPEGTFSTETAGDWDGQRAAAVWPLLQKILG